MMAMAMRTGTVLLRPKVVTTSFIMLLKLRCYRRLSRAFGRFRYRSPQDTECGAQRDQLQQEGAGEEPGHRWPDSTGGFTAKEQSRQMECDFITIPSIYFDSRMF